MINVDSQELQKFNQIAHEWWDIKSKFRPLHEINLLRVEWIRNHVSLLNKTILDVGCGGGILTESMAHHGAQVTGIDLSESALQIAKLHSKTSKIKINYKKISAEDLAIQAPEQFDIVTCMEMLEHVPNQESIVRSCAILTKPNGYVFFSTLNRNLKAYLYAILGAEYLLKIIPIGTHDYNKFISPAKLASFIRTANLEIDNFKGISYNPFTKLYSLTNNISINYMVASYKTL